MGTATSLDLLRRVERYREQARPPARQRSFSASPTGSRLATASLRRKSTTRPPRMTGAPTPYGPLEASDELVESALVDVEPALLLPPVAETHDRTDVEELLLVVPVAPKRWTASTWSSAPETHTSCNVKVPVVRCKSSCRYAPSAPTDDVPGHPRGPGRCQITCSWIVVASVSRSRARKASAARR